MEKLQSPKNTDILGGKKKKFNHIFIINKSRLKKYNLKGDDSIIQNNSEAQFMIRIREI